MRETLITISIDDFINKVVDEIYKPNTGKAVAKTVLYTLFLNLISLPLGRISFSLHRNKSKKRIRKDLEAALYSPFKTRFFEKQTTKNNKRENKKKFKLFLDKLSNEDKTKVLALALGDKKTYRVFCSKKL